MMSSGVYTIGLARPFMDTLARGLLARFGNDPLTLGKTVVLLPTQRGCIGLKEAFWRVGPQARILPRIIPLSQLEEAPTVPGHVGPTLPPSMPHLQQVGLLSQLIMAFGKKEMPLTANKALLLAEELVALLDEIHTSNVDLQKIHTLDVGTFSHHWQKTLDFLKIITEHWPQILEERGFIDKSLRRRENLLHLAHHWEADYPVILAGTTATRPATAQLAKRILTFSQGYVVLPGYNLWEVHNPVPPVHPQHTLQNFVHFLGVPPTSITPWIKETSSTAFGHLIQEMMAPSFDGLQKKIQDAPLPFRVMACHDVNEEALSISLLIRDRLEKARLKNLPLPKIAIITPHQELTRRLKNHLALWGIAPNISAGVPLHKTVVGIFLTLAAQLHSNLKRTPWLALLKHPLFYKHQDRRTHLLYTRRLDLLLRQQGLGDHFPFLKHLQDQGPSFQEWYHDILSKIKPFLNLKGMISLGEWLSHFKKVLFDLCDETYLWSEADGQAAKAFLESLVLWAHYFPEATSRQFGALLPQLMDKEVVHDREGIGSPVIILGALEARQYQGDITILAGLNEGTWPKEATVDPWLNKAMRLQLGLPDPQRRIGLSAHDFSIGFSAIEDQRLDQEEPWVYLTRSLKEKGTPTIPSRWLLRLETILAARDLPLPEETYFPMVAKQLHVPCEKIPSCIPQPCPPSDRRPRTYSVTDIELLMRDPYSFYCKRILKLKPLLPLDEDLTSRNFGILVHEALDRHHKDPSLSLLEWGAKIFSPHRLDPLVDHFWWPRFEQIAQWVTHQWSLHENRIKQFTEYAASWEFTLQGKPLLLKTVIDRLDHRPDGSMSLVDYKTGTPPTHKSVQWGFSPQLPLEWLIFSQGGKQKEFPLSLENLELSYWHLTGGPEGGAIYSLKKVPELLAETHKGVLSLLQHYLDENVPKPYLSCPWGISLVKNKDYLHLSRASLLDD